MTSTHCKNCGADLDGVFCRNCGQKADIHAISFSYLTHEAIHALTHTDKGFLFLIKDLLLKPGIVAKEYIEGKRKKYFNPLSFFVITSALHAYFVTKTGYFSASESSGTSSGRKMPSWIADALRYSNEHGRLLQFLLIIPLLALLTWIFFRKPRRNLAELSVLFAFIVGESNVLRILVFIPVFLLFPELGRTNVYTFEVVLLVYITVALKQFYNQNIIVTAIKSLLIMVFMIVFYWVLTIFIALAMQSIFH
jgi:hypothetical protein